MKCVYNAYIINTNYSNGTPIPRYFLIIGNLLARLLENEITDKLARYNTVQRFVGSEPCKKKDETLDGKTASGIVVWSV